MPKYPPGRRQPIRGALLPLPMLAAALIWFGWFGGPGTGAASDLDVSNLDVTAGTGTAVALSFGAVDATAELIAAPPANQMMMPMHGGDGHDDQIQVVVQLHNDTDGPVTVPFERVRVLSADGTEAAAVAGLLGDLSIRPHAAVEERLRFPVPGGDQIRLRIPDGDSVRTLTVPLRRSDAAVPSRSAVSSRSAVPSSIDEHVHTAGH